MHTTWYETAPDLENELTQLLTADSVAKYNCCINGLASFDCCNKPIHLSVAYSYCEPRPIVTFRRRRRHSRLCCLVGRPLGVASVDIVLLQVIELVYHISQWRENSR